MDSQQENVPPECEEYWFNGFIPCGKEFELPDVSSLINPPRTDISKNLPIPQDQLLDSPAKPDSAFVSDISNPLGAETQVASSPVMEMVPQPQFPRSANIHASPVRNQLVQSPASDSNLPLRKQQFEIVNSTNSSNFNLISSYLENNPTLAFGSCDTFRCGKKIYITTNNQSSCISVPPNTPGLSSNDCNISNHDSFPSSGCTSAFGSRVSVSIGNQKIQSSGFADLPSSGSNGSCARGNQLANIPVVTNPPGVGSHRKNIPNHLQNSSHMSYHARERKLEASQLDASQMDSSRSNYCFGITKNRTEESSSASEDKEKSISHSAEVKAMKKVLPSDDIRKKGRHKSSKRSSQEIFSPSSSASEDKEKSISPSAEAKAMKKVLPSDDKSSKRSSQEIFSPSSSASEDKEKSISPSAETKAMKKVLPSDDIRKKGRHKSSKRLSQEFFSPSSSASEDKEKSISPSAEAKAMKKVLPSDDIREKGHHKSSKRLSEEIRALSNIFEKRLSRRSKVPRIESSSLRDGGE